MCFCSAWCSVFIAYVSFLFCCKCNTYSLNSDEWIIYMYILLRKWKQRIISFTIKKTINKSFTKAGLTHRFRTEFLFRNNFFIYSWTFLYLRKRERERKRISLLRNNFSSNWFNFNFVFWNNRTVLPAILFLSKIKLSCHIYSFHQLNGY